MTRGVGRLTVFWPLGKAWRRVVGGYRHMWFHRGSGDYGLGFTCLGFRVSSHRPNGIFRNTARHPKAPYGSFSK